MKILLAGIVFMFSIPLFSQNADSRGEELARIQAKREEIQAQIKGGKNPALFADQIAQLSTEENAVYAKMKRIEEQKRIAAENRRRQIAESQKEKARIEAQARQAKQMKRESEESASKAFYMIDRTKSLHDQVDQVEGLLAKERGVLSKMKGAIAGGVSASYFKVPMEQAKWRISKLESEKKNLEDLLSKKIADDQKNVRTLELHGSGRVRGESKNNSDYVNKIGDQKDFITSRFRLDLTLRNPKTPKWSIFFQPQYTKTWAAKELAPANTSTTTSEKTANSLKQTSGTLYDTRLDVHQSYVLYNPTKNWSLKIGRQEIVYGDHLLVGHVGWHNIARSFDAIRTRVKNSRGWTELFYSKIVDLNTSGRGPGDYSFSGLYNNLNFGPGLKDFDLYIFSKNDHTNSDAKKDSNLMSYGSRLKSKIGGFDYRVEFTFQNGKVGGVDRNGEYQYDIEFGYNFSWLKTRISLEHFMASKRYDEHFNTKHKWLGFADQFTRRNIKGFVLHYKSNPAKKLTTKIDYHIFQRKHTDSSIQAFKAELGTGTENNSSAIASEIDFTVNYKLAPGLSLTGGYSIVTPGSYIKAMSLDGHKRTDATKFSYFQLLAKF